MKIEILIKYFSGQATAEEAIDIHAWKDENPEHELVFLHLLHAWHPEYDYQRDVQFLEFYKKTIIKRKRNLWPVWNFVAGISILIFLGVLWKSNSNIHTYFADKDGYIVYFPGGDHSELYKGTEMTYSQNSDTIFVTTSGDATFDLKVNPNYFIFEFGNGLKIIDIGTLFHVKNSQDTLTLTVDEGYVVAYHLSSPQKRINKNEMLIFVKSTHQLFVQDKVINVDWSDISIEKAMGIIQKEFHLKMIDKGLKKDQYLTLKAQNVTLKVLLDIMSETVDFNYKINSDELEIY